MRARPRVSNDGSVVAATPVLSMLWESVDPTAALTERFGFADPGSVVDWVAGVLGDRWAIPVDDCDRLVISDGNLLAWITSRDRRLIAKWSVYPWLFPRLAETATLTRWLDAGGLPVAAPVRATDGRVRVEVDDVSLGVYPVVDGQLLDTDDLAQVTEAGRMLARLHQALASYPHRVVGGQPSRHDQLVHNDFRSANILHDGSGISAVLDFEEVAYRSRVADLAKAAVLLSTRYRSWAPTSPEVREAFIAAYGGQAPLTTGEQGALRRHIAAHLEEKGWE